MKIEIYTDGGARGNPGPAALGVVIKKEGQTIKKYAKFIGEATNNEAEYEAVIFALKKVKLLFGKNKAKNMEVKVHLDSELVVQQLNHRYKIKEESLQPLFIKVWNLMLDFEKVTFHHVRRKDNQEADSLVNEALDEKEKMRTLFSC